MNKKFLCGVIPSPPDERDYSVCAAPRTKLPNECYLPVMPDIHDQQASNCVSQSLRGVSQILFRKQFGAGFVYGYRPKGYHVSEGMIPREAAQTVTNAGNVLYANFKAEQEMPDAKNTVDRNLDKLLKLAKKNVIPYYARCYTVEDIKTAIVAGNPVIFSAAISQYNVEKNNIFPCKKRIHGYHEMLIVGYKGDLFRVANSWGTDWGDAGFCWVSTDDVMLVDDILAFSITPEDTTIRRTLKNGMRGEDVRRLEIRLNTYSGISISADGVFNDSTERAVELYQKRYGLPITGIVDKKMWLQMGL